MPDPFADHLPPAAAVLARAGTAAAVIVSFIGVAAFLFIWGERKVSARMQDRLGPTRVGPFGLLQSLADGIKLVTKEDIHPDVADAFLFKLAPTLGFCATFCGFLALPFASGLVGHPVGVAAFFVLAALSAEVVRGPARRVRFGQQVGAVRRHPGGGPGGQLRGTPQPVRGGAGVPGRNA